MMMPLGSQVILDHIARKSHVFDASACKIMLQIAADTVESIELAPFSFLWIPQRIPGASHGLPRGGNLQRGHSPHCAVSLQYELHVKNALHFNRDGVEHRWAEAPLFYCIHC
jgi:hypothetical protein